MTRFAERSGKVLVLGIGNEILTDDGIGVRLVDDLKDKGFPPEVVFEKGTVGGLEILEFIQGYQEVLFLDAIKTTDGKAGDVYHMDLSDFLETLHLSNLHDVSFIQAIRLGKELGFDLPARLRIFAVEIVEDRVFSRNFTCEIEKQYPRILKEAEHFIRSRTKQYMLENSPG
ncbi:MAG: hydrogenase maturation protease [Bacteroidales bacterium]|nr:hydrogenase maturation protease [Bacteroidales bacterium]